MAEIFIICHTLMIFGEPTQAFQTYEMSIKIPAQLHWRVIEKITDN